MLSQKVDEDLKAAMKEKDALKVGTLRMLKAALGNYLIEKQKSQADDNEMIVLIQKQVKLREDSIEGFQKGGRKDLVAKETQEKAILEAYLPSPLTDDELRSLVEKAVQSSSLGLNPIVDKDVIRLFLPALTEERKRDIVKALKERLESARILVRRARDEAMKEIDAEEKAKTISEDEKFRRKQEVEKTVGECNKQIEDTGTKKEREIMAG